MHHRSNDSKTAVLCLGAGFTTKYLARHFDVEVRFLSRGLPADLHPFDREETFRPQIIVDSIPPISDGDRLVNPLYRDQWQDLTDAVFIHLSSTSVYDRDTPLVNEMTPPAPEEPRGKIRLDLEEAVLSIVPDAVIFRCGGIYGPGRCLPLSIAKGQTAHIPTENRYVSRIHVQDLCRLILSAGRLLYEERKKIRVSTTQTMLPSLLPGYQRRNLLNAVDPAPTPVAETLQFIRERWGLSVPVLNPPVTGRRIESLYTVQFGLFDFPDYRAGFIHCMQGF
jgi:hypothetical protein